MYVCMYVCMCVRMYVCMYVCMYVWMTYVLHAKHAQIPLSMHWGVSYIEVITKQSKRFASTDEYQDTGTDEKIQSFRDYCFG